LCHEVRPSTSEERVSCCNSRWELPGGHDPSGRSGSRLGADRRPILAEIDGQLSWRRTTGFWLPDDVRTTVCRRQLSATEFLASPSKRLVSRSGYLCSGGGPISLPESPGRFGPIVHDPVRLKFPCPTMDASGAVRDKWSGSIALETASQISPDPTSRRWPPAAPGDPRSCGERRSGPLVSCFAGRGGGCGAIVGSTDYLELFCNQGEFARQWR